MVVGGTEFAAEGNAAQDLDAVETVVCGKWEYVVCRLRGELQTQRTNAFLLYDQQSAFCAGLGTLSI